MPARVNNDPDKYIRVVKGGRYQARPFDMGVRYTIPGTFTTKAEARKVIDQFWWGKIKEVPKGTRAYRFRGGEVRYAVLSIQNGVVVGVLSWHKTREAAAAHVPREPRPNPPKRKPSAWFVTAVLFPQVRVLAPQPESFSCETSSASSVAC